VLGFCEPEGEAGEGPYLFNDLELGEVLCGHRICVYVCNATTPLWVNSFFFFFFFFGSKAGAYSLAKISMYVWPGSFVVTVVRTPWCMYRRNLMKRSISDRGI
jgi:hypothetical protein